MQIIKDYTFYREIKHLFVKGKIDVDSDYFIKKIDQGVDSDNNRNYRTNVVAGMTDWKYFLGDEKFYETIIPIINILDNKESRSLDIKEAWGVRHRKFDRTKPHDHAPAYLSFVLYLNDHDQPLKFQDIDETVDSSKGSFAIFSSNLTHYCERNISGKPKYLLSWNAFIKPSFA